MASMEARRTRLVSVVTGQSSMVERTIRLGILPPGSVSTFDAIRVLLPPPSPETSTMARKSAPQPNTATKCPNCGRPSVVKVRPFCSKRCRDVDLARWLTGAYAIPVVEADEADDDAG